MEHEQSEYEQGKREGKTEATLEGIAKSIDNIQSSVHEGICACHKRIDALWIFVATLGFSITGALVVAFIEIFKARR